MNLGTTPAAIVGGSITGTINVPNQIRYEFKVLEEVDDKQVVKRVSLHYREVESNHLGTSPLQYGPWKEVQRERLAWIEPWKPTL
jgi:hypothetical protein